MVESIGVLVLRRGLARSWLWAGLLIAVSVFRSNRNGFFQLTLMLLIGFLVGNEIRFLPTGKFLERSLPVDSPDERQLLVFMFLRLIHLLLLVPVHFHVIVVQMLMGIMGVNMIMMMVIMIVPMAVMMMVMMRVGQQTAQASPQQSMWWLR